MSSSATAWQASRAASPVALSARGVWLPARFGLFALVSVACCVLSRTGWLRAPAVVPLALAAVAVAMWHGAYDHVQAEQLLAPRLGRRWLPLFLGGYLALFGFTLLGWFAFPLLSLILFLLYSAWHFGTEPEETTPSPAVGLAALALGAAPIVAACHWHAAAVAPIFAQMLGGSAGEAAALTRACSFGCWPVLAAALFGVRMLARSAAERLELAAVAVFEVALFVWCDPLLAFAVYFCCWHTPEHLLATSVGQPGGLRRALQRNLRAGLLPWLASVCFLAIAFACGRHEVDAYQGELFILLSALTVPHMALNELRRARRKHPTSGARV